MKSTTPKELHTDQVLFQSTKLPTLLSDSKQFFAFLGTYNGVII